MIYDISPVNNYLGNDSSTVFDFDFYIENPEQLIVYHFDKNGIKTKLEYNLDYSINEFKNLNGSFICFPLDNSTYSVLAQDEKISLELTLPISQETQYNNSSLLNLEALEYSLDYLTRLVQIYSRKFELCVRVDECSDVSPNQLIENLNNAASAALNSEQNVNAALSTINKQTQLAADILNDINANYDKFQKIDTLEVTKANTDGSNLADSITNFDGQWIQYSVRLLSNIELNATSNLEIDLSEILPKDNCAYECILTANVVSSNSANYDTIVSVGTDDKFIAICRCQPVGSAVTFSAGSCNIIIDTNRILYLYRGSHLAGTMGYLNLYCYRRLGTNQ